MAVVSDALDATKVASKIGFELCWERAALLEEIARPLEDAETLTDVSAVTKGTTLVANCTCAVYMSLDSDRIIDELQLGQRVSADSIPRQQSDGQWMIAIQDGPKNGAVKFDCVDARVKLTSGPTSWARGPHARSNWLPVGPRGRLRLCVGGWPFQLPSGYGIVGQTDEEGDAKVRNMLEVGIRTFVNLTSGNEFLLSTCHESSYDAWLPRAEEIAAEMCRSIVQQDGRWLSVMHCPMPDEGVTSDDALATLLDNLLNRFQRDQSPLYVHCYGGHGRTGVACCSLLCLIYPWLGELPVQVREEWACTPIRKCVYPRNVLENMHESFSPEAACRVEGAIAVFNRFHAARELEHGGGSIRFPHSEAQLLQVARVAFAHGPFERLWKLMCTE